MLRQDLERHLAGQAVLAHRGSLRYRIGKFVRRHAIEVAAASIVLVALFTGLSIAVAGNRRASLERDRAEQALAESEGVTNFLMELFRTGDPGDAPPTQLSALDLLERGARRANELADRPAVHARLLDVIGQMSLNLGRLDEAQSWLEQAVSIRRETLGSESLDLAASLIHLSWVYRARSNYNPAIARITEALQIRMRVLPEDHPEIADALYELGWLSGGPPQERLYRQALDILPDTGAIAERRITVLQALSTNLRRQARFEEAVAAGREALELAERVFGAEHHTTGYAMVHLADHVRDLEQNDTAAERLYRRGLTLMTRELGESSTRLLHGLNSLAELLGQRGDAEAESVALRALAIRRSASGPEHPQVADQLQLLASELQRQGRLREAEAVARQALALSERVLGPRHPVITNTRLPLLAEILSRQGHQTAAEQTYRTALELTESRSVFYGQLQRNFGLMLLRHGNFAGAEEQLLQSLSLLERWYSGSTHPNVHETKRALMELYRQWGKPELVERYRVPPGRYIPY
jgi:tetratricopeptide (TPR) repeat protein